MSKTTYQRSSHVTSDNAFSLPVSTATMIISTIYVYFVAFTWV